MHGTKPALLVSSTTDKLLLLLHLVPYVILNTKSSVQSCSIENIKDGSTEPHGLQPYAGRGREVKYKRKEQEDLSRDSFVLVLLRASLA